MAVAIDSETHNELVRQLAQCEADGERMAAEIERLRALLLDVYGDLQYLEKHGPNSLDITAHIYGIGQLLGVAEQQEPGKER